jgi:hypothetical protein
VMEDNITPVDPMFGAGGSTATTTTTPNTTTTPATTGLPPSCLPPKRTCYQECQEKDKILTEMCRKLNKDHVIYLRSLGCKASCSVPSQGKTCSKKRYIRKYSSCGCGCN